MTNYTCCKGDTDFGHDSNCPQVRQAEALEDIAHCLNSIRKIEGDK